MPRFERLHEFSNEVAQGDFACLHSGLHGLATAYMVLHAPHLHVRVSWKSDMSRLYYFRSPLNHVLLLAGTAGTMPPAPLHPGLHPCNQTTPLINVASVASV